MPAAEFIADTLEPVRRLASDPTREPTDGVGLCLSGGGYRAMLFHTGVLWRLHEVGWLGTVDRVSSVSGGSMVAALVAKHWTDLTSPGDRMATFREVVVDPVRALASRTIDRTSVITGLLSPFSSIGEQVESELRCHLLGATTLAELPLQPTFVFNATNTGTGKLVRFTRRYVADWRVGRIADPDLRLSVAVTASAAAPPFLSPYLLDLSGAQWTDDDGNDLTDGEYRDEWALTDGAVYDNLGLETAWKKCRTLFVSDAGGTLEPDPDPARDWARHMARITEVLDHQVRSLRKRQVIGSLVEGRRLGAYVGIRSDITHFEAPHLLPAPVEQTLALAATPTRLKALSTGHQERLVNWGYAVADAGYRAHLDPAAEPPAAYPYPGGVG
ncbi:patatin-like phospholipase family protein [Nocardioides sp.]|uniref:patatin-like phospholipase family protein n=1 Tax=Nocardioides sp. TaxID=35761 RepID=UPI003565B944